MTQTVCTKETQVKEIKKAHGIFKNKIIDRHLNILLARAEINSIEIKNKPYQV